MTEWSIVHAWKACVLKGTEGSNPSPSAGSVLGRDCLIYPNVNFRGVLPEASVVKIRQELQILERRDRGK